MATSFLKAPELSSPDVSEKIRKRGIACAHSGDFPKAIKFFKRALTVAPLDNLAKGCLGSSLFAIGADEEALEYLDCESIYITEQDLFDKPYLNELADYVANHDSLVWEPEHKSTHNGHQSEELLHEGNALVQRFKKTMEQVIERDIGIDINANDSQLELVGWAVLLSQGGYQEIHLHRSGILSGVFYIDVPENLQQGCGALQFTQRLPWLPITREKADTDATLFDVKSGMLVIFPSHFWHCTTPFISDQRRISIAFDLVPVEA